jgi:molecular chaperone DnaK (HSP70)
MHRLSQQCETVKKILSGTFEANIDVEEVHGGKDFALKVTRALFEEICSKLLDKCIAPVDNAVKDSGLAKG